MDKECYAELLSKLKNIMERITQQIQSLMDQIENLQKKIDVSSQSEKKDITGDDNNSNIGIKIYRTPPQKREPSSSFQETSQTPSPSLHPVTTTAEALAANNDIPVPENWTP
ncbi:hypothetical protein Pmani_021737 [Petrolisthes manimaculis]|uniref:Uncharacterized protein n=1 Tax=Petrolisthes manimaculis TaxID=1843537 RepID=A0AAE1U2T7_9EUCA|nr:hypothetical protein Pmani_021737 [Petrolisthes manimaculis]